MVLTPKPGLQLISGIPILKNIAGAKTTVFMPSACVALNGRVNLHGEKYFIEQEENTDFQTITLPPELCSKLQG